MARYPNSQLRPARGFSLVELLITLAVIAAMTSMLFPAFSKVHDMARRLMCQNNMRSLYFALQTFADDSGQGHRPKSVHAAVVDAAVSPNAPPLRPQELMALSTDVDLKSGRSAWDGLGRLWRVGSIGNASTFYCPAHKSRHSLSEYQDHFAPVAKGGSGLRRIGRAPDEKVYGNYHYWATWNAAVHARSPARPNSKASTILGGDKVLLTDGLRTKQDVSHNTGCNVLTDDGETRWLGSNEYLQAVRGLPTSEVELPPEEQAKKFQDFLKEFKSVR